MKYSIKFNGYYPVGAVAIVEASNREEAAKKLYNHSSFQPHKEKNDIADLEERANPLVMGVEILLDGDY